MHLLARHVQEMDQKTNLKQSIIKQKQAGTPKMKAINTRKKFHCNSSTCSHSQFSLHLFNFIFIHMLLKEKKKRIIGKEWDQEKMDSQTGLKPTALQNTSLVHFTTLAVELIVNFEGPSLEFQLPDGHCRGIVRVKFWQATLPWNSDIILDEVETGLNGDRDMGYFAKHEISILILQFRD